MDSARWAMTWFRSANISTRPRPCGFSFPKRRSPSDGLRRFARLVDDRILARIQADRAAGKIRDMSRNPAWLSPEARERVKALLEDS